MANQVINKTIFNEQNTIIKKLKSYNNLIIFYKQRKWSIYLFAIFLVVLLIYLIVCIYVSSWILWITILIPLSFLFLIPMTFNLISINILISDLNSKINKNIKELYSTIKNKELEKKPINKFKFKKTKDLYKKRTIFIDQLYNIMSLQIIDYINKI